MIHEIPRDGDVIKKTIPIFEPMIVKKRDVGFMWRVVKVIKSL